MMALFILSSWPGGLDANESVSQEKPLAEWFPPSGPVAGWVRAEGPTLFQGDEIFQYMDGAGEIPRSYGFRQLGQAKYVRGEAVLEVVLFEMEDSAAAYGYFSVRDRDPAERRVPLEPPARLLPGFELIAWKGHYTLIVRLAQGSVADEVLLQWGRALLQNLPGEGQPPELLKALPSLERVPHSEKYVRGKAAFDAEVKFIPEDVFGLRQGGVEVAAADYQARGSSYRLVLLRFPDPPAASRAFQSFAAFQQGAAAVPPENPWATPDPLDRCVGAFQQGPYVGVVLGASNQKQAHQILKRFQRAVAQASRRIPKEQPR
jgi:hypothetical protein